jgi:hypothetical protein
VLDVIGGEPILVRFAADDLDQVLRKIGLDSPAPRPDGAASLASFLEVLGIAPYDAAIVIVALACASICSRVIVSAYFVIRRF